MITLPLLPFPNSQRDIVFVALAVSTMLQRDLGIGAVRPSVCLSVTSRHYDNIIGLCGFTTV